MSFAFVIVVVYFGWLVCLMYFSIFLLLIKMYVYVYVHVPEVRSIPWILKLQAVVSCLMWVLGVELQSSVSTVHVLNHSSHLSSPVGYFEELSLLIQPMG